MNVYGLKRNPALAKTAFKSSASGVMTATRHCMVMFPKRFVERTLATIGSENRSIGILAWIVDGEYFITMTCAYIPFTPTLTREVMVDGDAYVVFEFAKDSVVIPNLNLVKDSRVIFQISEEIQSKARVPWYLNYVDRCKIFRSAQKHAGTNIGSQREVVELMIAQNTRSRKDRAKYFRSTLKKQEDLTSFDSVPTGLKVVEDSASSTLTRITGSYMDRGITSALVNPSERVEPIENYLRV
jgi:hypothetical protein